MQLQYADFARFYEGSPLTEAQRREDFEVHICFLECLVRYFWRRESIPNGLGISFDKDAMAVLDEVDSEPSITPTFNCAACEETARKTGP